MEKNVLICTKLLQNPDDAYTYVYIQPVKCELWVVVRCSCSLSVLVLGGEGELKWLYCPTLITRSLSLAEALSQLDCCAWYINIHTPLPPPPISSLSLWQKVDDYVNVSGEECVWKLLHSDLRHFSQREAGKLLLSWCKWCNNNNTTRLRSNKKKRKRETRRFEEFQWKLILKRGKRAQNIQWKLTFL